jgi:hypothetical protein
MKKVLFLMVMILSMNACKQSMDRNPQLFGKWQGAKWMIFDQPSGMDATQVRFEFKETGEYSADFGTQHEEGKWRTEQSKLYTTATGKKEIMVKILELDAQKLHFEMNRGGQKETLELIKQ